MGTSVHNKYAHRAKAQRDATDWTVFSCLYVCFVSSLVHRSGRAVFLELERFRGLSGILFWLHPDVCHCDPAVSGLGGVCGDSGIARCAVWGYAGSASATAELQQRFHPRHEVRCLPTFYYFWTFWCGHLTSSCVLSWEGGGSNAAWSDTLNQNRF